MNNFYNEQSVQSPCINLCEIDTRTNLCKGCYRKLSEIEAWLYLSIPDRRRILLESGERKMKQSFEKKQGE